MAQEEGTRDHRYPRFDLLFTGFLERVAKTRMEGDAKYGVGSWQKFNSELIQDIPVHAWKHMMDYMQGDTSEDHLAHAACNIMFAMWYEAQGKDPRNLAAFSSVASSVPALDKSKYGYTVYLAGPIDGISWQEALTWRDETSEVLRKEGITCFSPAHAVRFSGGQRAADFVRLVNEEAIRQADAIIALFPAGTTTVGTPIEVDMAIRLGKFVVYVSDKDFSYLSGATRVSSVNEANQLIIANKYG